MILYCTIILLLMVSKDLHTTMILLKALYDLAEKHKENSIMDDINDYLKNRN